MAPALRADTLIVELLHSAEADVPVLRATAVELTRLEHEQDQATGNALAAAILRDPLMTLRVMRFLYSHRTRSQSVDITTIAHALMMLGQARFFREFNTLALVEDRLQGMPQTLASVRQLASQARLAALYARDWAVRRHDLDPEEVMVAALVHDIAELLMLLQWPSTPPQLPAPELAALRSRLFAGLGLPGLLRELTEDERLHNARVVNVRLACQLAHHCALSWHDPRLRADLDQLRHFLHISADEAWERVRGVALQAAREWHHYEVVPAASLLPLLPHPDAHRA